MNGLPKICNTRSDYEYIRAENIPGWQDKWNQLLEGRFSAIDGELVEDQNAPLFRLGFSVSEVVNATGFSGYTKREVEWYESHPERYEVVVGGWVEIEGWREASLAAKLLKALNEKLDEVDVAVAAKQRETFYYAGNNYYPDRDYISDQLARLPYLPAYYTREWKTADKVGVENVYVTLDKEGITAMAMAYFHQFNNNWEAGDAVKKTLKALYAKGEDVSEFKVVLE